MVPSDYPLICKPFSDERAHETRRRVTPSHVSVFLLGYPPESAPDRQMVDDLVIASVDETQHLM